jgi:hypothetical protein
MTVPVIVIGMRISNTRELSSVERPFCAASAGVKSLESRKPGLLRLAGDFLRLLFDLQKEAIHFSETSLKSTGLHGHIAEESTPYIHLIKKHFGMRI